jgi:hypothetical protein
MFQNLVDRFKNSKGSKQSIPENREHSVAVMVNVYDMYWINEYTTNIGLGVYHSGVEVHGVEYCYGGHPFSMSGVFAMAPKNCEELGENYVFKSSIEIGKTDFSEDDVKLIIESLGEDFRGDQYHLLNKNCNHFAEAFVQVLCGQSIPKWVNRLASFSARIPFIERAIPREWITPLALQDELESMCQQHNNEQDNNDLTHSSANVHHSHHHQHEYPPPLTSSHSTKSGIVPSSQTHPINFISSSSTSSSAKNNCKSNNNNVQASSSSSQCMDRKAN